ncbi:MAG: hypothetical protein ACJ786_33670 [Catenulispora sp.]
MAVLAIVVAWFWYGRDLEGHSGSWGGVTLAAVAVAAWLVVLAAVGARRDAGSGRAPVASALAVVLWFVGMLLFALAYIGFGTACEGTSAGCSWDCLNQSGSSWQALSVLCVVVATVAVPVLRAVSRRADSRDVGRIAPALVLVLFIVAVLLDTPHGTNTLCSAVALSAGRLA